MCTLKRLKGISGIEMFIGLGDDAVTVANVFLRFLLF